MKQSWLAILGTVLPALVAAQTGQGPYARIAVLRPHDGQTPEFEAGYIRHLAWHRQAGDPWRWYGWSIWAGERNRWFIYATFGHSASSLDSAVAPPEDERDNVLNVAPHVEYVGNALYEYLPGLSRGTGEPQATPRLELTTVDLVPGAAKAFEAALGAARSSLQGETLWYRMVAGGAVPRYVRLRPRLGIAAVLDASNEPALPDGVSHLIAKATVEILTLRPTLSLGLGSPAP
jgi:hypothetical protein